MRVSLEEIITYIEQADDLEINEIMSAVRKRFQTAFPDWEVIYLSCPKDDALQRRHTLDYLLKHFQP